MLTQHSFNQYMDRFYDFPGHWDSPSRCGLKVVHRKDGKILVIATELYRQNPGTPVTEWVAPLATRILAELQASPDKFIFIEHTPDLESRLDFYSETFDLVKMTWSDGKFSDPQWKRLDRETVGQMMEE